jgi:hypothetical protein
MSGRKRDLAEFCEDHELEDESERLFVRRPFEAGALTEENFTVFIDAFRAGSQLASDTLLDGGAPPSVRPTRILETPTSGGTARERERAAAVSRHVARIAATDQEVRIFRRSLLGSPTAVMSRKLACRLLRLPAIRFMSWGQLRNYYGPRADGWATRNPVITQTLVGRGRGVRVPSRLGHAREVRVKWRSFLSGLDGRAMNIGSAFGWSRPDTIWFLLTGEAPMLEALTSETSLNYADKRLPVQVWITIRALPHVSARSISVAFADEQRRLIGHRKGREIAPRNLALLDFVEEQIAEHGRKPDFVELIGVWNKRCKRDWRYTYASRMERDYKESASRVFLLEVRPKSGPRH